AVLLFSCARRASERHQRATVSEGLPFELKENVACLSLLALECATKQRRGKPSSYAAQNNWNSVRKRCGKQRCAHCSSGAMSKALGSLYWPVAAGCLRRFVWRHSKKP